jgi:hypothetical protein
VGAALPGALSLESCLLDLVLPPSSSLHSLTSKTVWLLACPASACNGLYLLSWVGHENELLPTLCRCRCCAAGLGCEDALMHLLNFVFPNVFETSPHIVQATTGAIDGCRMALGPAIILNYVLQVGTESGTGGRGGGGAG